MANIIYAKFNSGSEARNVLDPNTWIGGVVPGPNDVARLWYAGISTTREQGYFDQYFYYGQRDGAGRPYTPIHTNALRGTHNNEFSASKFMPSLLEMRNTGNYYSTAFHSLNTEINNLNYNAYYKNGLDVSSYYSPSYYKEYAKYFRITSPAVATSITIEGTTFSESDTTTYDTRAKMCNRMVELISGNIPSKYRLIGPHNGSGIANNAGGRETTYLGSYFTITFESGSDVAPPTNTHTVATQWYSSLTNILTGDISNHYRMMKTLITSSNPGIVMESGSYRYGTVSYDWTDGSGYWYAPGPRQQLGYQKGIGPGNTDFIKINFDHVVSSGFPQSCSIDTDYVVPTVKPYNDYPCDEIYLDQLDQPDMFKSQSVSFYGGSGNDIWTPYALQKYELTGSQHWNVGMIEMGDYNHFHVKDNSKITLHDLQDGVYYPAIDFINMGAYMTTLLITDNVTIQVSSSRTSLPAESGIWAKSSHVSVILSGSQNYSSSITPSSSNAGDHTIQISNLSDTFGIGDYVTIESTGSYRWWNPMYKNHSLEGDLFLTGSTKVSMSYKDNITKYAYFGHSANVREQPYLVSGSIDHQAVAGQIDEWTHPIENDEVIQIVSMSADTATVAKRYPKEGKVHQDMGLYTYDNFIETFSETPDLYDGSKRLILVDSTHRSFEKDDVLVIDNTSCNVLHATTYLSQSVFHNFSDGSARADQIFKSAQGQNSGSSIYTTAFNANGYGISTYVYWAEVYQKHTLLLTGSNEGFKGSGWGLEQGTGMQAEALGYYGYNASQYGGRSGSSNGYTALRLDPTLSYTWRNSSHDIASTNYLYGLYLLDNLLFEEGELLVSGSLIRDGHGDPTSSVAWDPQNGFGICWEQPINQSGAEHKPTFIGNPRTGYGQPYPYTKNACLWGYNGDPSLYAGASTNHQIGIPLGLSGSSGYRLKGNGLAAPYIYDKEFDIDFSASLDLDIDHIRFAENTGSSHIRVDVQSQMADVYLGIKDKEKKLLRIPGGAGKGGVAVWLNKYGSIHSINIKKRYQMLLVDTSNSFNAQDTIIEGGLLESHTPGKKIKFIGTEIVDVKGFKNLAHDAIRNEGSSSIKPYIHSICRTGTTSTWGDGETIYYGNMPFAAKRAEPQYINRGQANTNYYSITDFGSPVEFDTVGMCYLHPTYGHEYYVNNKMNNVSFEVCDDIGVDSPNWETVVATHNDIRQNTNNTGMRLYTFASGSVTARYLKHKCSGGTRYGTMGYHFKHQGIYNISASCVPGTAPASASIRDEYGNPTSSMCQIELANTKNWSVGDEIYFVGRTDTTKAGFSQYIPVRNASQLTGYTDMVGTAPKDVIGGLDDVYNIEAINGNVITLDRAPTMFLENGMIAYKFNRGGIRLEGMNNQSQFQFQTATNSPWTHIQNVTARNAYFYLTGDTDLQNYFFLDNLSVSSRYYNYYQYMGIGPGTFMRNVLIVGNWYGFGETYPNSGAHSSAMYFNVTADQTGDMNNFRTTMLKKWVSNFEHNNFLSAGWQQQYINYYGKKGNLADKIILKNSFVQMQNPMEYIRRSLLVQQFASNTNVADRVQVSNIIIGPDCADDFRTHVGYYGLTGKNGINKYFELGGKKLGTNLATRHSKINGAWSRYAYNIDGWIPALNNSQTNTNLEGNFVSGKVSKVLGGHDYVVFGHYYSKFLLAKVGNEFHLHASGTPYKQQTYDFCSLYCDFEVLEATDVRLDFDFIYKLTFAGKYAVGTGETSASYSMRNAMQLVLLNGNREVLDTVDFTADDFETIAHRKIHSLPAGVYRVETRLQFGYQQQPSFHFMSIKSIDLKLVTANLSKVVVYSSNFDILDLFDKAKRTHTRGVGGNLESTQAGGKNKVLKQSSDLGGTTNYKFNKIKL